MLNKYGIICKHGVLKKMMLISDDGITYDILNLCVPESSPIVGYFQMIAIGIYWKVLRVVKSECEC